LTERIAVPQVECRITATNPETHALVRAHLRRSAVYGGHIAGRGPRYCPSLEDKVVRFAERDSHQVFLEPEGLESDLVYPNGLSISLPEEIQLAVIRSIGGMERAEIARPGYAVEYDFIDPRALTPSLEVKSLEGLFLAGQVNGTTGYEEAAGQGLLAGVNAARRAGGVDPVMVSRTQAYIGVMIDDLVSRGVTEPYRMFTSRSEYRLTLRSDNADLRLTELGLEWGCVGAERTARFREFSNALAAARDRANAEGGTPSALAAAGVAARADGRWRSVFELLGTVREGEGLTRAFPWLSELPRRVFAQLATEALYKSYLDRQEADLRLFNREESLSLAGVDWSAVSGLSAEVRGRLAANKPLSVGAASRMEGITPAALAAIAAYVLKHQGSSASRDT
jgi:tRNA uridine 5-carboxymethylaminomethyl modification enzyme